MSPSIGNGRRLPTGRPTKLLTKHFLMVDVPLTFLVFEILPNGLVRVWIGGCFVFDMEICGATISLSGKTERIEYEGFS